MPIDIVVHTAYGPATHVVFNDADPEHFVIPVAAAPTSVEVDPDVWLLWAALSETAYVAGPPTIVQTWPAPGQDVAAGTTVDAVTVTFHTNVDVTATDISLLGASTGQVPFTIVSGSNVNPVVLQLNEPLPADSYTLTVSDGIAGAVSGLALDGEVADAASPESLPSGDGTPGGDAVIEFALTAAPIPTLSAWGIAVTCLLITAAGAIIVGRRGARINSGRMASRQAGPLLIRPTDPSCSCLDTPAARACPGDPP